MTQYGDGDYGRDCGMKVSEEDVEGGEKYVLHSAECGIG